ncbi:NTP transferase domain-containing protein [Dethiobacter alkaliphilus]|uniref:NTP transferase domain-containing protein n=1 Tax=Dethiobacter alkaliphilus TaxID=427926 RepID=UPI002225C5CA|nr:NTP transferase domain-containing protein [Dethiobacter alkaliphilus]MCW3488833.1 NTP transferase domain-containing protein [Dethiobacter alkaliphilus]
MGIEKLNRKDEVDLIVLLAGEGRRLRPLTNDRPKGLLNCNDGTTIFSHLIRAVADYNWNVNVIPVIGHCWSKVHEEINSMTSLVNFNCVNNPFYATAGPLVSLWLGVMQAKSERVIIANGDTLIRSSLVKEIVPWMYDKGIQSESEIGICVSHTDEFEEDDMKILLDEKGVFKEAGKEIVPRTGVLKSAGVICLRNDSSKNDFRNKLDGLLMNEAFLKKNYHWHKLLNVLSESFYVDLIRVDKNSWHEVDTIVDLKSMA